MNTRIVKYDADALPTVFDRASKDIPPGNTRPIVYLVIGNARHAWLGKNEIVFDFRVYAPLHVRSESKSYDAGKFAVKSVNLPRSSKLITTGKLKPRSLSEYVKFDALSCAVVISSIPDHVPTRLLSDGSPKKTCVGASPHAAIASAATKTRNCFIINLLGASVQERFYSIAGQ